ncbi:MAG: hypothetical protein ACLQLC_16460 [Candidatus Sulfotelmatobacter sp.]
MNPIALDKDRNGLNCGEMVATAEQELAAFLHAISDLFGSEQAETSAQDWLDELMAIDDLATDDLFASARQWRLVTLKVLSRSQVA